MPKRKKKSDTPNYSDDLVSNLLKVARKSETANNAVIFNQQHCQDSEPVLNDHEKVLNSMATIIGGGGVGAVGAVCFNKNEFLISTNNTNDEKKAKQIFLYLAGITKNSKNAAEDLDKVIKTLINKNLKVDFSISTALGILDSKKDLIGNEVVESFINSRKGNDIEMTAQYANQIQEKVKENKTLGKFLDYYIVPGRHLQRIKTYLSDQEVLFTPLRKAKFYADKSTHAEINIVNELFMQGKILENTKHFIGNTKKCCAGCHFIIESVNDNKKNSIKTSGTHGMLYVPWNKPQFLKLKDNELQQALIGRGHHGKALKELMQLAKNINQSFESKIQASLERFSVLNKDNKIGFIPLKQDRDLSPLNTNNNLDELESFLGKRSNNSEKFKSVPFKKTKVDNQENLVESKAIETKLKINLNENTKFAKKYRYMKRKLELNQAKKELDIINNKNLQRSIKSNSEVSNISRELQQEARTIGRKSQQEPSIVNIKTTTTSVKENKKNVIQKRGDSNMKR